MTISASVVNQQITASVGETAIDVSVGGSSPIDATVSGGLGPTGPPGTTSWAGIVDIPSEFNPALHAARHAIGGVDFVAPAAIGASTIAVAASLQLQVDGKAANNHTHAASAITSGTIASARLPNATASSSGAIIVGTGLSASSGVLSVAYGTDSTSACRGDDSRLSNSREWSASTVSQADAESGVSGSRFAFTPQRVFQAIAAWWNGSAAKTKLDGIAAGATANATDAQLRDRATHTGTQVASTISDFTAAVVAAAPPTTDASLLTAGTLSADRLPLASANTRGAVRIGTGVAIDGNGVISVSIPSLDWDSITNKPSTFTPSSHAHGNLSNDGLVNGNTTSGQIVVTTTGGALTTAESISASSVSGLGTAASASTTDFAPASHKHTSSDIDSGKAAYASVLVANGSGGAEFGSPYNQSLNTTDGPTFVGVKLMGGPYGSGQLTIDERIITSKGDRFIDFGNGNILGSFALSSIGGTLDLSSGTVIGPPYASLTDKPTLGTAAAASTTDFAAASHAHGNITNAGAIGSTSGHVVVTTTGGALTTAATISSSSVSGLAAVATSGAYSSLSGLPTLGTAAAAATTDFAAASHSHSASAITSGTFDADRLPLATTTTAGAVIVGTGLSVSSGTVSVTYGTSSGQSCQGNDARLSDSRSPTSHASSHQIGGSDVIGNVVNSPSQISSNQNDYTLPSADVVRLTSDAARTITGFVAGTAGRVVVLVNVGSFAITLSHQSTSSTAANRVIVPWSADYILDPAYAAVLVYDGTTSRWRIV